MAAPQNFRSAFNGFNREDVVHFIEYLNAKHTAELNQLNSELDLLRSRLAQQENVDALRAQLEEALAAGEKLTAENAVLSALCEELEDKLRNAIDAPAEPVVDPALEIRCAQLEQQLRDALIARDAAIAKAAQVSHEQELEAYRRAERTERIARERAEQIYRKANGALADATVKVDEAFAQIGDLSDKVSAQLAQLQSAVSCSKQALSDASVTLYTIRPDGEDK
jgi:small-conductance mechanosensitive channel